MLAQTDNSEKSQAFGTQEDFKEKWEKARKYQKKYKDAASIPDEELPEKFDWRDIDGIDFTNPIRDQAACGSCYTVSFTQIVEQRLKLKYGKPMPLLSPQMLMTCNYMNEGCDGGWPMYNGFFAENGYLVTEDCAPYL